MKTGARADQVEKAEIPLTREQKLANQRAAVLRNRIDAKNEKKARRAPRWLATVRHLEAAALEVLALDDGDRLPDELRRRLMLAVLDYQEEHAQTFVTAVGTATDPTRRSDADGALDRSTLSKVQKT